MFSSTSEVAVKQFPRMKNKLTILMLVVASTATGQITIEHAHLPQDGDTLITRNATLAGDVDLEDTGADHVWNFESDILQVLNLNPGTPCNPLSELSILDQAVFNNPFYPEYNSDFGLGFEQTDLVVVSFENSYQVYKNSGDVYAITGVISTINSIPLIAQMNDRDVIYDIPLVFGTSGNSDSELQFEVPTLGYYGLDQSRNYACDGWGTLNILGQSFEVLRVRSVVNATDSIYAEFIGNGISFDRPETVTYEWLSSEFIVPVLRITVSDGTVSAVQIADIVDDTFVDGAVSRNFTAVYPNPFQNELRIDGEPGQMTSYKIYAASGRFIQSGQFFGSTVVEMSNMPSGGYILRVESAGHASHFRILRQQ
jgi:hypothetical protein